MNKKIIKIRKNLDKLDDIFLSIIKKKNITRKSNSKK